MKGVYRSTVESDDQDRLDKVLPQFIDGLSRGMARKVIALGGVFLNGRRCMNNSKLVVAGDKLEVSIDGLPLDPWVMSKDDILFEDKYLIAVNKPAGIDTQPTPARYRGTLYDNMLRYLRDEKNIAKPSLAMVQRLDRDTSGVIIFSIHQKSHKNLTADFMDRSVVKSYLALTEGILPETEGEIHNLIAGMRTMNKMLVVKKGGKEAHSTYRVEDNSRNCSLVRVGLHTGRRHQIRVHLATLGNPILGDRLYGGAGSIESVAVERQMLHAISLTLKHPVTKDELVIKAPIPDDMYRLMNRLELEIEVNRADIP